MTRWLRKLTDSTVFVHSEETISLIELLAQIQGKAVATPVVGPGRVSITVPVPRPPPLGPPPKAARQAVPKPSARAVVEPKVRPSAKVGGVVRQLLKPQVLQQLNEHLGVNIYSRRTVIHWSVTIASRICNSICTCIICE